MPGDYAIQTHEYEFAGDRDALNALRGMKPVQAAADYIARKLGKPYIEGQFIGSAIRVSDEQFPGIQRLAVLAATALCLPQLPHIYVSGDKGWTSETYGTATDAFVVLGSFLTRQLTELELLFVLAHELGHVKSGHAMYRTVAQILSGTQQHSVMSQGILGLLDINKLVSMPIELPLLSWVRQSEITADAAGLAVVGDLDVARKVLIVMALKSADLYRQINLDAYLRQQEELDHQIVKLSEYMSQNTPYIATRVRLMGQYAQSPQFCGLRGRFVASRDLAPLRQAMEDLKPRPAPSPPSLPPPPSPADDELRGKCPRCGAGFSVPKAKLPREGKVALRCSKCKETFPVSRAASVDVPEASG